MSKPLQHEQSHKQRSKSSPSAERLRAWRLFLESALSLVNVLDEEMQAGAGIPQQWYDVLVNLDEGPQGMRMNELADKILYSKSGFTRVVDRMEEAGLVRRVRPDNDRRSIFVVLTESGTAKLELARRHHRDGINRHFSAHLSEAEIKVIARAFAKVSRHVRPLR